LFLFLVPPNRANWSAHTYTHRRLADKASQPSGQPGEVPCTGSGGGIV